MQKITDQRGKKVDLELTNLRMFRSSEDLHNLKNLPGDNKKDLNLILKLEHPLNSDEPNY